MKTLDQILDKICWKLRIGKSYRVSFPRFDWCQFDRTIPHLMELLDWLESNANNTEWKTKKDVLWRRFYFKNKDKATMFKMIWG